MQKRDNVFYRQERASCLKEARKLSEKGSMSPSDQRKFDSLMLEADEYKTQYELLESRSRPALNGRIDGDISDRGGDPKVEEHRSAFVSYLRQGLSAMPAEQRAVLSEFRDMGTGNQGAYPGATSGFFVPVGFIDQINEALKYTGPLLDPAIINLMDSATGQILPYPTENDTLVSGERVAESAQVTSQDVSIGALMLGAYKYSTKLVKVSLELMQDSAFDMETFLIQTFAKRLGRILNSDFTVGSGVNQPLGIVTGTLQNGNLLTAVGSATNDGVGGPLTLGSDDLVALEHSIDPLYRVGSAFMMHDTTLRRLKQTKDKYGRPLWMPGLVAGAPDTFNGRPLLINNAMDAIPLVPSSPPVTRNTVCFGSYKRFLVRRVKDMSVLRLEERFADFGIVAFLGFARYDATPLFAGVGNAYPFSMLQHVA